MLGESHWADNVGVLRGEDGFENVGGGGEKSSVQEEDTLKVKVLWVGEDTEIDTRPCANHRSVKRESNKLTIVSATSSFTSPVGG